MNINEARKYTDIKYATKQEVTNEVGSLNVDRVWKDVTDYREGYRFPLELKLYDMHPTTIVMTPQIIAMANSLDRKMSELVTKLTEYKVYEKFSDEKQYTIFKRNCIKEVLYKLANITDYSLESTSIEQILEYAAFKNNKVNCYYKAYNFLLENQNLDFDKNTFKQVVQFFNLGTEESVIYREDPVSEFEFGCNASRIAQHMDMLFSLYDGQYELSPFIIASIINIYFLYINPLKNNSYEVSSLLFNKVLDVLGYKEAGYLISVSSLNTLHNDDLVKCLNEYKKTGDITYPLTFFLENLANIIDTRIMELSKLSLPTLYEGGVKVVTKEVPVEVEKPVVKQVEVPVQVEKVVEKEVPVEVIKEVPVEVIKEIQVEKIVEKEVPVEVIKEVPIEVVKEIPVEKIIEVEVPIEVERVVEKEVIREVKVPVEVIKEVEVPVEVTKEVEVPVEVIKEVPVEVIKEVIKEVPYETIKEVIREVPVEVEKIVEKEVPVVKEVIKEVPYEVIKEVPVEKVVTKEVPVEVIKEVPIEVIKEVPVERIIEKEVPVEIEKIVEKEVIREIEVPKEVIKEVEVPVEVIKEVEVPVEVEKVVEKEVIREVEVPKEVIKEVEVPVEVIKEVPIEIEKVVEKEVIREVEVPVEVIKEIEVPVEVIKEVPVEVEKVVEKEVIREVEVPVEVIKEVEVPVEVIKEVPVEVEKVVEKEVIREVKVPVEVIKEVIKEVPISEPSNDEPYVENEEVVEVSEPIKPKPRPSKVVIPTTFKKFSKDEIKALLESDNIAARLVQLNPYIRDHQARYYEANHDFGMFYTISSFKEFADCAYETARTSMDFLCDVGLYEKRQIKNKFIYTPVSLED